MRSLAVKWLIVAALALLVAGNVHAAGKRPDDAPTAAQITACAPDARRFCSVDGYLFITTRELLKACMIAHKSQLSRECREAFK